MHRPLLSLLLVLPVLSTSPVAAQVPRLDLANRPAVEGITRTTLREDARFTVTRVQFALDAAEPRIGNPTAIRIR